MKKVIRFTASNMKYGGNLYESEIDDAISDSCLLEVYYPLKNIKHKTLIKYLLSPVFFIKLWAKNFFGNFDIGIYSLESCFFLSSKRMNIVIVHHFDPSYSNFLSKVNQWATYFLLSFNKKKIDKLVVVSSYWELFFRKKGFKNIEKIYNSFDINYFSKLVDDNSFKIKCSIFREELISDKFEKIIYIGNCHPKKGGGDVLKEIIHDYSGVSDRYLFITSGYKKTSQFLSGLKNYKHLELTYLEYLILLKSSDLVVTNSKFKEGWCRAAHEAILLGTPVLGSGIGGMSEVLDISKQKHINNYQTLIDQIDVLLKSVPIVEKNKIETFNRGYFKRKWLDTLND